MSTITVKDGTTIYYKDWGKGPVVTFSHGWPLSSDAWDGQMLFLAPLGVKGSGVSELPAQRFLLVTDLKDSSQVVLQQSKSSSRP